MFRLILLLLLFFSESVHARLFFIGSNPRLSMIAFPQDSLYFPFRYAAYTIDYQSMPWWGDVDEFTKKPDNNYSSSEENIHFAMDETDSEKSVFERSASLNLITHTLDFNHPWNKNAVTLFTLKIKTTSMESRAAGNLRSKETDPYSYVPFEYTSSAGGTALYFETVTGYNTGKTRWGLKAGIGLENTGMPESSLKATAHGIMIDSERLLWGWTTSGCNHIFQYSSINGDAWYQNDFSSGWIRQYDLQLGFTSDPIKAATRYRKREGALDSYMWLTSAPAGSDTSPQAILSERFTGEYKKQEWGKEIDEDIWRIYANWTFMRGSGYKFNILFFFALDYYESLNVNADNPAISNDVKEAFDNYIIEANPNINYSFGTGVTLDAGLLIEGSYTRAENTYRKWVPGTGGLKEVYWESSYYIGEQPAWERFSYSDEYFFDYGWEINFSAPVYNQGGRKMSLAVMLFNNNKITWRTQYYGTNETITDDIVFRESGSRKNTVQETWLNSSISIFYEQGDLFFRLTYIEPLIYNIDLKTEVFDKEGGSLYSGSRVMQSAVQENASLSVHPHVLGGSVFSFMAGYKL